MTAQEYYQGHPQISTPYPPPEPPPQYQAYPSPQPQPHRTSFNSQQRPPFPQASSDYLYPQNGTPQPQPWQQPYLQPPHHQVSQRPPFPPSIQTQSPFLQNCSPPQPLGAHLRPIRSYSEPPSPRDYDRHRRRHASHGRHRSPSRSSSDSNSSSRSHSRDRSRERHHRRHRASDVSRDPDGDGARERPGYWADRARGKKDYKDHMGKRDHTTRNTFFGAFGGGAIGDLIAPGLGTLGGALLGSVGGHSAGRSRSGSSRDGGRSRTRQRDTYDEEWEEGRRRRGEI